MLLAFLALTIVGVVFFIAIIAFYSKKDFSNKPNQVTAEKTIEGPPAVQTHPVREAVFTTPSFESRPEPHDQEEGQRNYIPILHFDEPIPGLKGRVFVHFDGSGSLFTLETPAQPSDIHLKQDELESVLKGRLLLTSRYIVIFNEETQKKFALTTIEQHHFQRSYMIIKRKKVKVKKDIIKIDGNLMEFQYILHALMG
jgi:hypothetical protein